MLMCLVYSRTMYRQCLIKIACVVSSLTRCQSDSICISITRLTVLKALRTLEDTAGQAIPQILPWSSCSMVYVKGGSNQLLTTWLTEALRVTCLLISWCLPQCRTGSCCHYVWHGCQQCQGLETVGYFWKDTLLQVSSSRNCSSVWPSSSP